MIKVIDGKRYNTDTATMMFRHTNGAFSSDFNYRSKTLFRTAKDAWFLRHYGGPMSDMAEHLGGGGLGWGEEIEPVSDDDAFGFLEAHSDDSEAMELIQTHFPDRFEEA